MDEEERKREQADDELINGAFQKLLDDYRALEKNFHSVGEGYEQALLTFEQMEEALKSTKAANEALQQRCQQLEAQLAAKD